MSNFLLKKYIQIIIENLKIDKKTISDKELNKEDSDINEFSGVGSIAGYTGPLGVNPDDLGRKKNKN